MLADLRGSLLLDDKGCIRVSDRDDKTTPIWPADYDVSVEGDEIRILYGKGRILARIGDEVSVGGGGISGKILESNALVDEGMMRELFERCPGH